MTISLFSGQGSQYPGMGKDISDAFPHTAELYDIASDILGRDMRKVCFDSSPEELALTVNAQPAILLTSLVCISAAINKGHNDGKTFSFDGVAGHSLGEYAAMAMSGMVSLEDVFRLIKARAEAMNLSEPYMKNEMIFVVPADSEVKSMDDLEGKTVGVQTGSTAQEILEAWDKFDTITESPLEENVTALNQMELGFSDAVFLDSVVANYFITSNDKDYEILPGNLESEEYAIGFRKNDQKLRDEVQSTLSAMKKDGKLGEISEKWFGSDVTTVE